MNWTRADLLDNCACKVVRDVQESQGMAIVVIEIGGQIGEYYLFVVNKVESSLLIVRKT